MDMLRCTFFVLVILSECYADYTIRTRQKGDRDILTPSSPIVVSTIAIPPYISTFLNGSNGLVPDLLEAIGEGGGIPKNATLQLGNDATPGSIGENNWSGIVEDAKLKYTHFAIGPIYDDIFLAGESVYFGAPWHKPPLKLVVRSDSPLAQGNHVYEGSPPHLDLSQVDLIAVDKSAELQRLVDYKHPLPEYITDIVKQRPPIIVSNICEGLRRLGALDDKDNPIKSATVKTPTSHIPALILNSLEADHYASGNQMVKIISPYSPEIFLGDFKVMSHLDFRLLNSKVGNAVGKNHKRISEIVNRWSKYDKDACKKLREALKGSATAMVRTSFWIVAASALVRLL